MFGFGTTLLGCAALLGVARMPQKLGEVCACLGGGVSYGDDPFCHLIVHLEGEKCKNLKMLFLLDRKVAF